MSEQPFAGYVGRVWATCWQSMSWLSGILASGTSSLGAVVEPVETVIQTLLNGLNAIDAFQAGAVLSIEYQNLLAVQALNLPLDATTLAYMSARISGVAAAASGISALPTVASPFTAIPLLQQGQPAVPDPGYLEWCMGFVGETPPIGTFLPSGATTMAQSWLTVTNAIGVLQGGNPTVAYDTAARQYRCSAVVATGLIQLTSSFADSITFGTGLPQATDSAGNLLYDSNGDPIFTSGLVVATDQWCGSTALPTILLDAASLAGAPSTLAAQQSMVVRNALVVQMQNLAYLRFALWRHNVTQPLTATLRNNESLADLAARTTGNFENWPAIAALNRLSPPYPGPSNPAIALSGKNLFVTNGLTTPGVSPDPDDSGVSYFTDVLGADWDWGPINGAQPPWTGDIPLIIGYLNFARAIGRRLQTPLGALVFHSGYGSRIPPEVGAIQAVDEAARLLQYGNSAVLADSRTGSILNSQATTQPGFLATYAALIAPVGPGAEPVGVTAEIGLLPNASSVVANIAAPA